MRGFVGLRLAMALACCAAALTGRALAADTIAVSDLGIVADAPLYIGLEKGYFAKAGVTLSLERFASAAQTTVPLSTGQLQVAGGGPSAGLFNALARTLPIRIAMARSRDMPGFSGDNLSIRSDLHDEIKTIADLKGRRIAINAPAGSLAYMTGKMLESAGLKYSDADVTYMPWPDMAPAFANKAIDVGALVDPFTAQYVDRHLISVFKRAADVLRDPPLEVSVMLYNKDWIERSPDQARAFTVAWLEGVRDYYDAMRNGPLRAEVIDILAKRTSIKDKALYDKIAWSYLDPNGDLSVASLKDQQDWYAARGEVEHKVDLDSMIDLSFRDYALKKLGRVDTK